MSKRERIGSADRETMRGIISRLFPREDKYRLEQIVWEVCAYPGFYGLNEGYILQLKQLLWPHTDECKRQQVGSCDLSRGSKVER